MEKLIKFRVFVHVAFSNYTWERHAFEVEEENILWPRHSATLKAKRKFGEGVEHIWIDDVEIISKGE